MCRNEKLKVQSKKSKERMWFYFLLLAFAFLLAGCSQNMTWQAMGTNPRYNPLAPSDFFADGQAARQFAPDTVARGHTQDDTLLFTGKLNGQDSTQLPYPVSAEMLTRGEERFNIYCAPCHGRTGYGNGMIVQRGFLAPPSFHIDRLRQASVGYLFGVITNGFGAMPSYAAQIPVNDRWAIIAYVRALQLSQHATIDDVPASERSKMGTP